MFNFPSSASIGDQRLQSEFQKLIWSIYYYLSTVMIILRLLDPVFGHFGQASPRLGKKRTKKTKIFPDKKGQNRPFPDIYV